MTKPKIFQEIDDVKTSLADIANQAYNQIKQTTVPYNYQGAVFSFISDDGYQRDFDVFKPLFDAKGIKMSHAVITDNIGQPSFMTLAELKQLQDEGYEILNHSKSHNTNIWHTNLSSVPDSTIDVDLKAGQDWLKNNGFEGYDVLVYPWGQFGNDAVRIKRICRKYCLYGVNSGIQIYNSSPIDNMYVARYQLNKAVTSLATIQSKINETIANNGWLVFLMHGGFDSETDIDYIGSVIDYIQSKGVPILPFREAAKYKGNALSVGEYTDNTKRAFIGNDGKKIIDGLLNLITGVYTDTAGNTMNDILTKYPLYQVSTCQIKSGSADPLTGVGGTLITYHGDYNFSWQMYVTATSPTRMFLRNWLEGSSAWSSWIELTNQLSSVPLAVNTIGVTRLNTDPITVYSNGVSYNDINLSNTTLSSFPEGLAGTLITYRNTAGDVFSWQDYHIRQTNKRYSRYWDATNNVWTAWVKISAV